MQPTSRSGGKTGCLLKRLINNWLFDKKDTVSVAYLQICTEHMLCNSQVHSMSHVNVMGLFLHNYRAGELVIGSMRTDNNSCRQNNNKWAVCCRLRTLILSFYD
jgi:hypothetical protein